MEGVPLFIKLKHISHCLKADKVYDEGMAKAMNIDLSKEKLPE